MTDETFLEQFSSQYVWTAAPAKRMFRYRKEVNKGMRETHRLALTMKGVVDRALDDLEGLQASDYSTYQIFEEGDLVFKLIDLENIKTSRVGLVPRRGIMSPAYIRLVPVHRGADTRFYAWFFFAVYFNNIFNGMGGGVRQNLTPTDLLEFPIPLPDLATQRRIADFLDRETARIDLLIEKKHRLVALLGEERSAVISHSVTRGIDPDAPMKDSGEDWLGQIPEHWEVVPPTVVFTESKERARDGDKMLSATQKYGVIPLSEFEALEKRQVTKAFTNLERRKHVEIGDFVISMRSMDGGLERAHATGSVRSSYSVLKAGPEVEGRFYGAVLKSSLYIQALRLTSNFIRDGQDMNFGHFRKVRLPITSISEQTKIADYIEAQTTRIDDLVSKTSSSIDLLKEWRSALITAAVTGQIDVEADARSGATDRRLDTIQEEMGA